MNSHNSIIADQMEIGRRMARADRTPSPRGPFKPKVKTSAKPTGHEAYLKGLQDSGASISIITLAGEKFSGRLKHADKYTVSLEVPVANSEATETFVFFKHAIESFSPQTPPPFLKAPEIKVGLND